MNMPTGIVSVKDYGAKGNGSTDDTAAIQAAVAAAFGSPPNGSNSSANSVLYFPPGNYQISSPIVFTKVQGGRIEGSGRFTTQVQNQHGGDVFVTNGFAYCSMSSIELTATPTGRCLSLDWDGSGSAAGLQSNSFRDMFFNGGAIGVEIGHSGFMGSETLFENCFWISSGRGLETSNLNAEQTTIVGGNFQACGNAIYGVVAGIFSVGFQESSDCDIFIPASASDAICVHGCRSESTNFINMPAPMYFSVLGCNHNSATATYGYFFKGGSSGVIAGCVSTHGQIVAEGACRMSVQDCEFSNGNWLDHSNLWPVANASNMNGYYGTVEAENITAGWQPNRVIIAKRRYTSDSASDYVITAAT